MKKTNFKRLAGLLAAGVLGGAAGSATAVEYGRVVPEKSAVTFVSKQMNVPVDGRFGRFTASIAFDPAKPAAAKATLDIDVNSIDAGNADANNEVKGKAWFDAKSFPAAQFASTSVKALGGDRYEVAGTLSIKGRKQNVVAPVTVKTDAAGATFDGALTIKRGDFGIGEGAWGDFSIVANEVQIKFHVLAAPSAPVAASTGKKK